MINDIDNLIGDYMLCIKKGKILDVESLICELSFGDLSVETAITEFQLLIGSPLVAMIYNLLDQMQEHRRKNNATS